MLLVTKVMPPRSWESYDLGGPIMKATGCYDFLLID